MSEESKISVLSTSGGKMVTLGWLHLIEFGNVIHLESGGSNQLASMSWQHFTKSERSEERNSRQQNINRDEGTGIEKPRTVGDL